MKAILAGIACLVLGTGSLAAQHSFNPSGVFDPAVPAPASVLGYQIGERFTPHHLMMRYLDRLAATSNRVALDTVARTFEGREVMLVIVTSPANQARRDAILRDAALVADPRQGSAAEVDAAARRLPAIVWLGHSVHGGEASGVEAGLALLYQLAAGQDPETLRILDSVVVLIDPSQNPDGHERHVHDVERARSALGVPSNPDAMIHRGTWPGARTSHYQFDLNRDWFIHSHPESRGRAATFLRWWPHVAVDLHEMGSESSYFFAPPMEPINKNVHGTVLKWWDIIAAANAAAFDAHGWSYFRREGYDEFYPGYGVSWPTLTGAAGMTYEQASSAGGAIARRDGQILTLAEAARHHYTAAYATLAVTARRAGERVADYRTARATAISEGAAGPVRAVILERDRDGRADSLVQQLASNGIAVQRVTAAATLPATPYGDAAARPVPVPPGSYVVDLAQPQGRLARAILEPDARLDSAFIREELESRRVGRADRFYDITAWSLPYTHRVSAWTTSALPGGLEPVRWIASRPSSIATARYAYAFEPGSDAGLRMLSRLLAAEVKVWFAPRPFALGGKAFSRGAFLVRVAPNGPGVHEQVSAAATESGAVVTPLATAAVDEGTDLGSNSVRFVAAPRVGLLGGAPVSGNSFGFAWYTFDQRLGYPVVTLDVGALNGIALERFDVLVLPSVQGGVLDRTIGDAGRERLAAWVRGGGTLITLESATAWLAAERTGLARIRVRQQADSGGTAPLPASIPGAIARATADTLSLLLAGIDSRELPVMANGSTILTVPANLRPGEAVIRYAPADRLRLSGYLWPEVPARLAGSPFLWTESVGRGRVIGFLGDPNFRDLWRGLLPLFANAVFLGPAM